jgi:hypothetical protein
MPALPTCFPFVFVSAYCGAQTGIPWATWATWAPTTGRPPTTGDDESAVTASTDHHRSGRDNAREGGASAWRFFFRLRGAGDRQQAETFFKLGIMYDITMPNAIRNWKPPRVKCQPAKERAHYVSAAWRALRLTILVRDAYTCAACGRIVHGAAAHVDHIRPLEQGGTDAQENLQTLCESCHGRKTRAEQRWRGLL